MDNNIFITPSASIKEALKRLDETAMKVLFVLNEKQQLIGSVSDGDIRRCILINFDLNTSIEAAYHRSPLYLKKGQYSDKDVKKIFLEKKIEILPIVDSEMKVVNVVHWKDVIEGHIPPEPSGNIGIPVVIMAGGKGTRLAPFTNVLPKPLIPLGEKTILEIIMERFQRQGASRFFLTLNYRGEMISAYLNSIKFDIPVEYLWEKEFNGTAGSLSLLGNPEFNTFIVSNCDILVNADYEEVLKFHYEKKAKLTVLSSIQHHKIPYGVVDFKEGGIVTGITEKPEFTFPINTGVYIVDSSCLKMIPEKEVFHMTHLLEALLAAGETVLTYPVNEGDYQDIGQWEEYNETVRKLGL